MKPGEKTTICMQGTFLTNSIRYIIGVFCYYFYQCLQMNSRLMVIWKFKRFNFLTAMITFALIPQCPTLNLYKIFSYNTTCFNFSFLTICQSLVIGPDSLYCGKRRKQPTMTLTLIAQCPMSNLS